jgi:hypothetical protein
MGLDSHGLVPDPMYLVRTPWKIQPGSPRIQTGSPSRDPDPPYGVWVAIRGSRCFRAELALGSTPDPGMGVVTPCGRWAQGAKDPQPALDARRLRRTLTKCRALAGL